MWVKSAVRILLFVVPAVGWAGENVAEKFAFQLSLEKREVLLKSIASLQLGVGVSEVEKRVGKPDVKKNLIDKAGHFKGHLFRYYLARVDKGTVNEQDQNIDLLLDSSWRLVEIVRHRV